MNSRIVFHLITSTGVGGAEVMLEKLVANSQSRFRHIVISLTEIGPIGIRMKKNNIKVTSLGMKSALSLGLGLIRLIRLIIRYKPALIVSWMYHANLLAAFSSIILQNRMVIWNVRCGLYDYKSWKLQRKLVLMLCVLLSRIPRKIVFNSYRSLNQHKKKGFSDQNCVVVYNGFESRAYAGKKNNKLRKELEIPENSFLIGGFGRNINIKRMRDLLHVCFSLRKRGCPAELLFIGRNYKDREFIHEIEKLGLGAVTHLVDQVSSLNPFFMEIDALGLCSQSEGFPNVIGEAVFSNVPVFSTDVSDLKGTFLQTWQISKVGDIEGLTDSAFRIYSMTGLETALLTKRQLNKYVKNTELKLVHTAFERLYEHSS